MRNNSAQAREDRMQHLDEGTIHAWLDGALSADEAARVDMHVTSCETCSEAVAEVRGLIAASSRILTALDDVPRAGARGGRGDRRRREWFLVRSRIAAVVALVVAGGALALAVRRDSVPSVALQATADSGSEVALVAIDSPALETRIVANAEPGPRVRDGATARRGAVGAAAGNTPARRTSRERDVTSVASVESAPLTVAQTAPPAAAPARTDDTARVPFDVAAGNRVTTDARGAEARSSAAEKVSGEFEVRRSAVEAAARLAEPGVPQARLRPSADPSAPRLLTEERMVEDGRVVLRRMYRVEETLVTLDERAPGEREREELVLEQRRPRVEERAYAEAAPVDSTTPRISTIRWVDSRGAEFILSGAQPPAQLERIRKLLGY